MAYKYFSSALFVLAISCLLIYTQFFTTFSFGFLASRLTKNASPSCIFIFGDSTSDVGTNNYITDNLFRADGPPYGIDSDDSRPTGRFSNGFITVDFICQLMGFKRSPPPFLFLESIKSDFEKNKFRGFNFASAGSGILGTTQDENKVVPMSEQVSQFIEVQNHLTNWIGQPSVDKVLSKSVFLVSMGSNDIVDYFFSNSTIPTEQLIQSLMVAYEENIKALYKQGARKFGIVSVLPLGCLPFLKLLNATGGCFDVMNDVAQSFHLELETLLQNISSELQGFKYSLANSYKMIMNVIQNPDVHNFKNVDDACCGGGRWNAEQLCTLKANLCGNRDEYAFWDGFHPTQAAAQLTAQTLFDGSTRFVSPINFGQLTEDFY